MLAAWLLSAAGVGTAVCAWGAFHPASQVFGRTARRLDDPSAIALTFDDGPNPEITPRLLELLDRYAAPSTFFVIGRKVAAFPELTAGIAARGHLLGNHTHTHPNLVWLSPRRIAEELWSCDRAILAATGRRPGWMRPPYGFRGPQLDSAVRALGYAGVVMWNTLAWDWKQKPAQVVIQHLGRVRGGDIVLLHDGDHRVERGDRGPTLAALEFWLPRWQDAGLRCVTLEALKPLAGGAVAGGAVAGGAEAGSRQGF